MSAAPTRAPGVPDATLPPDARAAPMRVLGAPGLALGVLGAALLLGACAAPPAPPGAQVDPAALARAVIPGASTRDSLLAALGPTRKLAFDSGYEVWLYQLPAGAGRFVEVVILLDPQGVVRKSRRGEPAPPEND